MIEMIILVKRDKTHHCIYIYRWIYHIIKLFSCSAGSFVRGLPVEKKGLRSEMSVQFEESKGSTKCNTLWYTNIAIENHHF